ncbi:ABC transporter permease [Salmonella sp. NCTC 11881]|nr:ABC transporter permease [Salmonella sp. NCTC 11881]
MNDLKEALARHQLWISLGWNDVLGTIPAIGVRAFLDNDFDGGHHISDGTSLRFAVQFWFRKFYHASYFRYDLLGLSISNY